MSRDRRWIVQGVALAVLWLLVRGAAWTPASLFTESVLGLVVGLTVSYTLRRMYAPQSVIAWHPRVVPATLLYLWTFLRYLVVGNVDVAWRVLAPSMPIDPVVVEIPLRVRSPVAVTTIANSVTLTPGTLTMDYDDDANALIVHSIDGSGEGVADAIRTWEDYALIIFREDRSDVERDSERRRIVGDDARQISGDDARPLAGDDAERGLGGDDDE